MFRFESKTAAITPQDTPSPDCFFTVQKKRPWWRQFAAFTLARQEYFPHYSTFKHRVLWCHKRKWLWQKMSNQRLSAGLKLVWCGLDQLVKSNERSRYFPQRCATQSTAISTAVKCEVLCWSPYVRQAHESRFWKGRNFKWYMEK